MRRLLLRIGFIASLFFLLGCRSNPVGKSNSNVIFVSIQPLKYFVERIADSTVQVKVLVPPGSSPEMFEPTPRQMTELSETKAFFAIGLLDFEKGMEAKLRGIANFRYIDLSQGLNLIEGECHHQHEQNIEEHHHRAVDPHTWMSAANAKLMAQNIAKTLGSLFPEMESEFSANLIHLMAEIDSVDRAVRSILDSSGRKTFVIYHPALGYFARDYGLTQLSIEFEGKNPSAKGVMEVVERCRAEGISVVLSQSQFDTHNAQMVARELNGRVVKVDQLQENWPESMIQIAKAITGNIE